MWVAAGAITAALALPGAVSAGHPVSDNPDPGSGVLLPSTPAASVSGTPMDGQTLTGSTDSPGFGEDQTTLWLRCDSADAGCVHIDRPAPGTTYPLTTADVGKVIKFRVRRTNGSGVRESEAATGVIAAAPPARQTGPFVTGTATEGRTLSAQPGSWTGTPPITFAYQWQRCEQSGSPCADIPGASGASHLLTGADVGKRLRVGVTADNPAPGTSSQAFSNPSPVVLPAPPQNTALPDIQGTQREGELLTSTRGTWTGREPITYAYEWRRCAETCTRIPGANSLSYRLTSRDVGRRVLVQVTATNAGGSTVATDTTGTISNRDGGGSRQLSPFPVVVIAGRVDRRGARLTQLRVRNAPRRSIVTIRCRGRSCPFSRIRRRARGGRLRVRGLERRVGPGTVITIMVRQGSSFGKYTRFRIRRGRPPSRVDGCVRPGSVRRTRCPRSSVR